MEKSYQRVGEMVLKFIKPVTYNTLTGEKLVQLHMELLY